VERGTVNPKVKGSNPLIGAIIKGIRLFYFFLKSAPRKYLLIVLLFTNPKLNALTDHQNNSNTSQQIIKIIANSNIDDTCRIREIKDERINEIAISYNLPKHNQKRQILIRELFISYGNQIHYKR
tara:strand:+ start:3227 stop:3601 length:375 start_codon:yes stop_codon:yes gene_type:complete